MEQRRGVREMLRGKANVLEMKCLRSLVGVSQMDRVRNEEVCRRAGIERELASRADQRVLRWFGQVERMVWQTPHGVTFLDNPMSSNSCSFQYKQPFATSYTQLLAPHLLHFSYLHVIISLFISANDF